MSVDEEILRGAELDSVPFPLASRRIRGAFDFARYRYVGRDGQQTTPTGRVPRTFELRIPMFDGMDPSWYPVGVENLLSVLTDSVAAGAVEYVDPFLGAIDVKIVSWELEQTGRDRNGARIQVVLEDNDTDTVEFITRQAADPRGEAEALSDDLDADLADAGVTEEDLDASFAGAGVPRTGAELDYSSETMIGQITDGFFDDLVSTSQTLEEAEQSAERFTRRMDAIVSLDVTQAPAGWPILAGARRLAGTVLRATQERLGESGVRYRTYVVPGDTSLAQIALQLYGDASRRDDLASSNQLTNPNLILAGTVLRVPVG